ncbi:MAG: TIGR00725 family protein [Balneolaceae bacterium]|jgi:uncharacterized protein (TIGR00725 family)
MAKKIIGVMGPGDGATKQDITLAEKLGSLIARQKWALLTGGRNVGVMNAASKGAQSAGGLTIGILPSAKREEASAYLDIPICTGMGSARNNINVLSSDVVIACGSGLGTTSEIMLSLKAGKPVVLLNQTDAALAFIKELTSLEPKVVNTAEEAVDAVKNFL